MNRTLPSAMVKFAPPGWKLWALMNWDSLGADPLLPSLQTLQGYCFEFGGMTVLKSVYCRSPSAQTWPRYSLAPLWLVVPGAMVCQKLLQSARAAWSAAGVFCCTSRPVELLRKLAG